MTRPKSVLIAGAALRAGCPTISIAGAALRAGCPTLLALGVASVLGCTQTPVTLPLRSLERSGDVSFVCLQSWEGRDINSCPDYDHPVDPSELYALVTQTSRGEVAVLALTGNGTGVIDDDPSTPGFTFLRVGANPTSIVSTPGGVASFVAVAESGREGIFALPSSCIGPPRTRPDGGGKESMRDFTSWPACSLPAAPGKMKVLIDPPDAAKELRVACGSNERQPSDFFGGSPAAGRAECAADLSMEQGPAGRRKLLVTLPDLGELVVIDAQKLLDREPGSFEPCEIESYKHLTVDLPGGEFTQPVPPELQLSGCTLPEVEYAPMPDSFSPRPSGIALSDDDVLYIGDGVAPVIHVLDAHDPCAISDAVPERPPLLPVSYGQNGKVVVTSDVAVSPASNGKRYLYAVDEKDQGSIMIFDVSADSAQRTPLVRPGAERLPFEPVDRIKLSSPVRALTFVLRDDPEIDPASGVAVIGERCQPDPAAPEDDPGILYRPTTDRSKGAAPHKLRGLFGFAALTSGQVVVLDVDDFDAACRRPKSVNPYPTEDFRGCKNDPDLGQGGFSLSDNTPTVTDEVSCRMVLPHRIRSGRFGTTSSTLGVRAPSLRSAPTLNLGGTLPTDQSDNGVKNPKVLAVDFPSPAPPGPAPGSSPAQVFVGTRLLINDPNAPAEDQLDIDPNSATRSSLVLPLNEPRSYGVEDTYALSYEGKLLENSNGRVRFGSFQLEDADAQFCNSGVEDVSLIRRRGEDFGVGDSELLAFSRQYGDYVQITGSIPDENHDYWKTGVGASCGGQGRTACTEWFGPNDVENLDRHRDFRIVDSFQDSVTIEPRFSSSDEEFNRSMEMLWCCFPSSTHYAVRASNQWILNVNNQFRYHQVAGFREETPDGIRYHCGHDCSPRRKLFNGRAFEVSNTATACLTSADKTKCNGIGPATANDLVCTLATVPEDTPGATEAIGPTVWPSCVFETLTARFAVYRGLEPSKRGMTFSWVVAGGFAPLVGSITTQTLSTLPQSMVFVPQLGQLAIADSESAGLVLMSVESMTVSRLFF